MLRLRAWTRGWAGALIIAALITSPCRAAQPQQTDSTPLIKLASSKFPNLTRAERALLAFAEIDNVDRGEWASGGTSADPLDSSNDPKDAERWLHDRDVRATLIRWMCVDPEAIARIDPNGMRIVGARIVGALDLSRIRVPFAIALVRCSFPKLIRLSSAEIPELDLTGSYVDEIDAGNLIVKGNLFVGWNSQFFGSVHALGEVYFSGARVGGNAAFGNSHLRSSTASNPVGGPRGVALALQYAEIGGELYLCCGFESNGEVRIDGATIKGDLVAFGGHFSNPNDVALDAVSAAIDGNVSFSPLEPGGFAEVDGLLDFTSARVGNSFVADHIRFTGKPGDRHGLTAPLLSVRGGAFIWQNVELNDASLDLRGASVGLFIDDETSWPAPGKLLIHGFTYTGLSPPNDARSRLRWLALEPGFQPQPYRQLAKQLRENGDDAGAIEVLIAKEDARFRNSNWLGRAWAGFLKITIGYGHRPLLALLWSLGVVFVGWGVVYMGKRGGVMRLTWPETSPPPVGEPTAQLYPLLYSLDVFLPFVNLHQEHYWWPDAEAKGQSAILGYRLNVRGSLVLHYLWLQIIAGWLLSAIFVAGITGLLRND